MECISLFFALSILHCRTKMPGIARRCSTLPPLASSRATVQLASMPVTSGTSSRSRCPRKYQPKSEANASLINASCSLEHCTVPDLQAKFSGV